ncbi:MAG: hypothetical protein MJD61_04565, partial [Proteobacteria bacterium]|nr:hypothetical protein [Pseudomonadota bacterium]
LSKASGQNNIAMSALRRRASKARCRANTPCIRRRRNTAGRDGSKSKWRCYFDPTLRPAAPANHGMDLTALEDIVLYLDHESRTTQ